MKTNRVRIRTLRMLVSAVIPTMTAVAQPRPLLPPPPAVSQATETVQGTVSQYLMNPQGEVDGLLLRDGAQVHFPSHMSADLTQAVKTNDNVSTQGVRENTVHLLELTICDKARGTSVIETRSLPV